MNPTINNLITSLLEKPPIAIALVGPNGAGKSTLAAELFGQSGLPFINADVIARTRGLEGSEEGSAKAASLADQERKRLVAEHASFIFETVFSDPVGDKLAFMERMESAGYSLLLIYIGLSSPQLAQARVSTRVLQGGHDVPDDRIEARYFRTLANLKSAIRGLSTVVLLDNSDAANPYRVIAVFKNGKTIHTTEKLPTWAQDILS